MHILNQKYRNTSHFHIYIDSTVVYLYNSSSLRLDSIPVEYEKRFNLVMQFLSSNKLKGANVSIYLNDIEYELVSPMLILLLANSKLTKVQLYKMSLLYETYLWGSGDINRCINIVLGEQFTTLNIKLDNVNITNAYQVYNLKSLSEYISVKVFKKYLNHNINPQQVYRYLKNTVELDLEINRDLRDDLINFHSKYIFNLYNQIKYDYINVVEIAKLEYGKLFIHTDLDINISKLFSKAFSIPFSIEQIDIEDIIRRIRN